MADKSSSQMRGHPMMKVSKVFGTTPLPDEYHKAIGEILVGWSWLEFRVAEAVWHLVPMNRKATRAITSQIDIRALTKVLANLAPHRIKDAQLAKQVTDLANKITTKSNERNILVHGTWQWDAAKKEAVVYEYRPEPILGRAHWYNLIRLSNFAAGVRSDRSRLQQLLDQT